MDVPACVVENIQVVTVISKGFVYLLIYEEGQVILFLPSPLWCG